MAQDSFKVALATLFKVASSDIYLSIEDGTERRKLTGGILITAVVSASDEASATAVQSIAKGTTAAQTLTTAYTKKIEAQGSTVPAGLQMAPVGEVSVSKPAGTNLSTAPTGEDHHMTATTIVLLAVSLTVFSAFAVVFVRARIDASRKQDAAQKMMELANTGDTGSGAGAGHL